MASPPRGGDVGWSVVCDCGISLSCSFTFLWFLHSMSEYSDQPDVNADLSHGRVHMSLHCDCLLFTGSIITFDTKPVFARK